MRRTMICLTILAGSGSSAPAALSVYFEEITINSAAIVEMPGLAQMQSWSLMVTHTVGDWASAGVRVTLPAGNTFFHHPLGGNTRPHPAFVAIFPALAYDTFVTSPLDTGTSGAPAIIGGHPASPTADFGGSSGVFSVSWGDLETSPPGTYEIARLTFPHGLVPTIHWEGDPPTLPNSSNTSIINPEVTMIIPQIPEPAFLCLLAAAGLLAARRRNA